MSTGKVVVGLLAGIAAGAALGILFAPDKGTNTRKKISRKSEDLMDEFKEKLEGMMEEVTEKFDAVKDCADDLISQGKSRMKDMKNDVKNAL
jgi:gas vesicle protein